MSGNIAESVAVAPRESVPNPHAEYFDLLDADGTRIGTTKLRGHVHRDGDWHRAVHIWLVDADTRQILIQLRAPTKDSWASHWDVGCAGHVTAGESSLSAAVNELSEELGVTVQPSELTLLATLKREVISQQGSFIDREFTDVYAFVTRTIKASELVLQSEEVSAARFIDIDEYVSILERVNVSGNDIGAAEKFVVFPDLAEYRTKVFTVLKHQLETLHAGGNSSGSGSELLLKPLTGVS